MYRRMKNILGVSFIILAIVLSQIPMDAVKADETAGTEATGETQQQEEENQAESNENGEAENQNNQENPDAQANENAEPAMLSDTTDDTAISALSVDAGIAVVSNTTDTVTVTFDTEIEVDGVTVSVASQTITKGTSPNQPPAEITIQIGTNTSTEPLVLENEYDIAGVKYKFKGWYESSEYLGTTYDFSRVIQEDITLYARWESSAEYKVTFIHENGVENYPADIKVIAGETIGDKPKEIPIREGYTFIGWFTAPNGSSADAEWKGWNKTITKNIQLYAGWKETEIHVTFHYNGGKSGADDQISYTKTLSTNVTMNDALTEMAGKHYSFAEGYSYEKVAGSDTEPQWYKDANGFIPFDKTENVSKDLTLYLKWTHTTEEGYTLNGDNTILYNYVNANGAIAVTIPETVEIIATNAFSTDSLQDIGTVTLSSGIKNIQDAAFPPSEAITKKILLKTSKATYAAAEQARQLATRYTYFKYSSDGSESGDSGKVDIDSSLNDINTSDVTDLPSYPQFALPSALSGRGYSLKMVDGKSSKELGTALKNGKNFNEAYPSGRVYYMEIDLIDSSGNKETYTCQGGSEYYTIVLPVPRKWASLIGNEEDATKLFEVYTVDEATKTVLEKVELSSSFYTNGSGVKCVEFHPLHFSEYALVYIGTENPSTPSTPSGGGSEGGSSSGGGNSSESGSSGGSSTSSGTSSTTSQQTTTSTTVPTPTPLPIVTPDTGATVTPPTGTSQGANTSAGHVKDATPKTGDPMEYRTIFVCIFFSMGILMLLSGQKKKTPKYSNV